MVLVHFYMFGLLILIVLQIVVALNTQINTNGIPINKSPKIFTIGEPILTQECHLLTIHEILSSMDVLIATETAHQVFSIPQQLIAISLLNN